MKSETKAKPKRQNRTVTLYFGNTLAEYEELVSTNFQPFDSDVIV